TGARRPSSSPTSTRCRRLHPRAKYGGIQPERGANHADNHTSNGYDTRWIDAINGVLEDRDGGLRIADLTEDLWNEFIGPMIDAIERQETRCPRCETQYRGDACPGCGQADDDEDDDEDDWCESDLVFRPRG